MAQRMVTVRLTPEALEDMVDLAHFLAEHEYQFADPSQGWEKVRGEWIAVFVKPTKD